MIAEPQLKAGSLLIDKFIESSDTYFMNIYLGYCLFFRSLQNKLSCIVLNKCATCWICYASPKQQLLL